MTKGSWATLSNFLLQFYGTRCLRLIAKNLNCTLERRMNMCFYVFDAFVNCISRLRFIVMAHKCRSIVRLIKRVKWKVSYLNSFLFLFPFTKRILRDQGAWVFVFERLSSSSRFEWIMKLYISSIVLKIFLDFVFQDIVL